MNDSQMGAEAFVLLMILILGVILGFMFGWPTYRIWQREQAGKAELAEAEWSKRVAIEEAKARLESAEFESQAEIERAKGAAEAQKIIAETLTPEYLRYLWIQHVENSEDKQIIYIPTESGLPILEASRLNEPTTQE